ncbi:MAG: DUF6285 domain-containing protein [Gammaproteobacteria bacterium]|nr:DUF6285 domain-containing protein [Gammaproteobacteria bacterium]
MINRPDGPELLRTARKLLREDIVETIPREQRYQALMVANAMAIAEREAKAGDRHLQEELRMLTELYGDQAAEAAGAHLKEKVAILNRRLAKDIRAGVLDGACAQGVRALLRAQVVARLRISNPKYLKALGTE